VPTVHVVACAALANAAATIAHHAVFERIANPLTIDTDTLDDFRGYRVTSSGDDNALRSWHAGVRVVAGTGEIMARELVPVDESDRFAGAAASAPEDADFTDAGRREILRRLALGAVLAALGTPSWLRAGTRQALATAASTGLVPLSSSGEIKGAYATKSILAIIGVATGIAAAATSAVPVVGVVLGVITAIIGLVGALVGIFWNPSPGQEADTIWNLIKAKVQNLINVSISDAEYAALSGAIDGLKNNMLDYIALVKQHKQLKSAQSLSELRQKYIAVDAFCIGVRPQFLPPGSESRFLVLFAQFANLHHILLQDMVLNGKAYGVEPGLVANDVEKLAQTVAQNCATFDRFWIEFLANCAHSRRDSSMGAAHPAYHGADGAGFPETYYSWVEDALYDRNRDVNNSIAQVTTLAKDYRDLWPYMGGLKAGPASLTRELWIGPFGEPDCFELGGDFSIIDSAYKVHNGSGHPALSIPWQNTSGYAAAQKPGDSPMASLRWINVQQLADPPYLAFPSHFTLARVGDNQTPAPGQFWLSLSNADGGPVTGVTVSLTAYFVVVRVRRFRWPAGLSARSTSPKRTARSLPAIPATAAASAAGIRPFPYIRTSMRASTIATSCPACTPTRG
jgi:hypothetical protein